MSTVYTSNSVGLFLMQAGLSPRTLDIDMFQIVWGRENYTVYTDQLPDLYLEKRVPLELFEYMHEDLIVCFAMDKINLRRNPVVAYRGPYEDSIFLRTSFRIEDSENDVFKKAISKCFIDLERSIDAFGQACDVAVSSSNEDDMANLLTSLKDPDPDSPWILNQKQS